MIRPKSDLVKFKTMDHTEEIEQCSTTVSHSCSNVSSRQNTTQKCHSYSHRSTRLSHLFVAAVILVVVLAVAQPTLADDNKSSSNTSNHGPRGLFSHVNNWFSRLRGNRDNHHNSNDDKKNDDKKEESSTKPNTMVPYPGYPTIPGMPPGAFSPMGPFGPQMMAAMPAMYGPMGMATQQFAQHAMAPGMAASPGAPRPPGMMPAGAVAMPFNPMGAAAMSPMAGAPPMGNPFAYGASHMMPVHHDFSDQPSMHQPHHHPYHSTESFGPFGPNSPYGSFGSPGADSSDDGYSSAHQGTGAEPMDAAASSGAAPGGHGPAEFDAYHKKK